jgi:hypothetical protein
MITAGLLEVCVLGCFQVGSYSLFTRCFTSVRHEMLVIKRSEVYKFDLERRNLSKNKMAAALVNSITLFCLYPTKDVTH